MRIALVLVAPLTCACDSISTRLQAAYLQTELVGDVALAGSSGAPNLGGRQVDAQSGLGLDADEPSLQLRGEAAADRFRLRVSGFRHDQSGNATLSAPFGDLGAGTTVASDLEFTNVKAAISYDLIALPIGGEGVVRLAPGVAADYLLVDLDVRATSFSSFESLRNEVIVPLPFLLGEVELGPVYATADFGGSAGNLGDGDGIYWDFETMLGLRTESHVELFGGYRWLNVDVAGTASARAYDTDVVLRGWFVGGGIRF